MVIAIVLILNIVSITLMYREYKKTSLIFWVLGALLSLISFCIQ